jgi:hypothetical protein
MIGFRAAVLGQDLCKFLLADTGVATLRRTPGRLYTPEGVRSLSCYSLPSETNRLDT